MPVTAGPAQDSASPLRFTVLGPFRAWLGGAQLELGPPLQRAVLAALVLRPDVTLSQHELLDRVWGAQPPGTDVKTVPGYVFRLRKCLQAAGLDAKSVIVSDRRGYRFVSDGVRLDTTRFEELAAEAGAARRAGELAAAVDACSHALALFEGEPLAGLPGPFAKGERRRLEERRIALSQEKLDAQIRLGRCDEAIDELSAWTEAHPHSEPLAALLVRALYGSGRQADALKVFPGIRDRLIEDLGVEPGEEMQRVHQAVLRGDDDVLGIAARHEPAPEPAAARRGPRDELPADVGELTGRDRELTLLTAPFQAEAVTVAAVDGVAGVGKTALAVRAARVLRERCPDGCLFVDLHGHSRSRQASAPQRVLRRLLRAVGVDDSGMPDDLDELAASWRSASAGLRVLLVLDDASSAEQVRPLIPAGAGSWALVTSRRRLAGLDADHRISLGPLDLDAAAGLLDRLVGSARAGRERSAVRELAQLCGRLPLALRIAGARLQNRPVWTFADLVARLADDGRRLGELTAEDRSVEAAFQLSYDRLPAAEQHAFRVLGLAPAPEVDRLALAAMLDCAPDEAERALENLVDASLLQQPSAGRYRLHDLVAAYAQRLAATEPAEAITARALRLYVAAGRYASEWGLAGYPTGPELTDVPFTGWQDATAWLDAAGDLADVVGHAVAVGQIDYACWIADAVFDYLVRQGRYHESRTAGEIALSRVGEATDPRMVSALRFCVGSAHGLQAHYEQARQWYTEALEVSRDAGDRREELRALGGMGVIDAMVGRHADAVTSLTEVASLAGELGDDWLAERATSSLGYIHHSQGRHDEALGHFARFSAVGEKINSPAMLGRTLCYSGSVHLRVGRFAEAATALRRAVELAEQISDVLLLAGSLTRLGAAEQELGNPDTALELHHRALAAVTDQTAVQLELEIRNRLGDCYLVVGRRAEAREQFEAVLALATRTGRSTRRALEGLNRCEPPGDT